MQEFSKLKSDIINSLITIPGIKGFVNSNNKNTKLLSLNSREQSISIIFNDNKYIINLNIIVSFDVKTKDLCTRIDIVVRNIFKKAKKSINVFNIYIRGVM